MVSKLVSEHTMGVPEWFGIDFRHVEHIRSHFSKIEILTFFFAFFLYCLAYFMHKIDKNEGKKLLFQRFFKNEAFNQKSGTVKLLGYV